MAAPLMIAMVERPAPIFDAKSMPTPGELYQTISAYMPGQMAYPIPRPQRYEDFARAYGQVIWVYAAVSRKARDISCVPIRVTERAPSPDDQAVGALVPRDHPLRSLLTLVNPFMTFPDLLEGTSANLDLTGNAYWLLFSSRRRGPVEMWPLRPDRVEIIPSPDSYIAGYRYRTLTDVFDFLPEQVIHFREFNPWHDYYGQGALGPAWDSAVITADAHTWNRNLLRNSGRMDGLLTSDQKLDETQAVQAGEKFRQLMAGPRNAGKVMVMGAGLKYQTIATTPKEMDFIASAKLTREEILAAFLVPAVILFLESGDIGRRVEQIRDYFHATIRGRCTRIAGTLNEFLAPQFDGNLEISFDVDRAIAQFEDRFVLAQTDDLMIKNRVRTPNELRKRDGLPPLKGGDIPFIASTMIPAATAATTTIAPGAGGSGGGGGGALGTGGGPAESLAVDSATLLARALDVASARIAEALAERTPAAVPIVNVDVAPATVTPPDVHVHSPVTVSIEPAKPISRKIVYDKDGRIESVEPQEPS
jgi:HK97 family phage portal protein